MRKVSAALKAAKLDPIQCRMAWILFHVNGEKCALGFIAEMGKK